MPTTLLRRALRAIFVPFFPADRKWETVDDWLMEDNSADKQPNQFNFHVRLSRTREMAFLFITCQWNFASIGQLIQFISHYQGNLSCEIHHSLSKRFTILNVPETEETTSKSTSKFAFTPTSIIRKSSEWPLMITRYDFSRWIYRARFSCWNAHSIRFRYASQLHYARNFHGQTCEEHRTTGDFSTWLPLELYFRTVFSRKANK